MARRSHYRMWLVLALIAIAAGSLLICFRDASTDSPLSKADIALASPAIVTLTGAKRLTDPTAGASHNIGSANVDDFAAFDGWMDLYFATKAIHQPALLERGIRLAETRARGLKQLIRVDPSEAWNRRVPLERRHNLPAEIDSLLEQRVSGRGTLQVIARV